MFHPVPTTDENSNNASPINDSVPTANLTEESSPTSQDPIQIQEYTEQSLANPLTPLLVASGIVIALILVVILIKRR
jgi:hypothetical protein